MKDYIIRIATMEKKLKTLEKKIKQLGDGLVEHADSAHYFSGSQRERVESLKKRLEL